MTKEDKTLPSLFLIDALNLELPTNEKIAILSATAKVDPIVVEYVIAKYLTEWDQPMAAAAICIWANKTDRNLWQQMLVISKNHSLPQRIRYTILENCEKFHARSIIEQFAKDTALMEMSSAYHAMILEKSVQYGIKLEVLSSLAANITSHLSEITIPENKALVNAIGYLARFSPSKLETVIKDSENWRIWCDLIKSVKFWNDYYHTIGLEGLNKKTGDVDNTIKHWPPIWLRHHINSDHLETVLKGLSKETHLEQYLYGIDPNQIKQAIKSLIKKNELTTHALSIAEPFLDWQNGTNIFKTMIKFFHATKEKDLPKRFVNNKNTVLKSIHDLSWNDKSFERKNYHLKDASKIIASSLDGYGEEMELVNLFENNSTNPQFNDPFYTAVADAFKKPDTKKLDDLSILARKNQGLKTIFYFKLLAKFKNDDKATLKTLDYIRTEQDYELYYLAETLTSIGSPRAIQEVLSLLSRPNISPRLQGVICEWLGDSSLENVQNELRSSINEISNLMVSAKESETSQHYMEIKDALTGLLAPISFDQKKKTGDASIELDQFDSELRGSISKFDELSGEVRKALRTAMFFQSQVENSSNPSSIDLSPVIDMQYKAIEFLFRESFEESCKKLIENGVLQRKLDIIGYARPIPQKMDEFEKYLSNLPIVKDIPFFSKFKLRKMLRAICQYRPGKRFTLDGLKAFGLFFLAFGRQECRYGLQSKFPLCFPNDKELSEFTKELHLFQDFRNRAIHEGLPPDAANNMDEIWKKSFLVIDKIMQLKELEKIIFRTHSNESTGPQVIKKGA